MRRKFYRWCINWWADRDKPAWLRFAIQADESLRRYDSDLTSLSGRLRKEAAAWAACTVSSDLSDSHVATSYDSRVEQRRRVSIPSARRTRIASIAIAVSGVTGLAFWHGSVTPENSGPAHADPQRVANLQVVGDQLHALVVACSESVRSVEHSVTSLPQRMSETTIAVSDMQSMAEAAKRPIESASRSYGQALAFVERNVRKQLVFERWERTRP